MSSLVKGAHKPHEAKETAAIATYKGEQYVALEFAHLRDIYTTPSGQSMFSAAVQFKSADDLEDDIAPVSDKARSAICTNHDKAHSVLVIAKAYLHKLDMYRVAKKVTTSADSVPFRVVRNTKRNWAKYQAHKVTEINSDFLAVEILSPPTPKIVETLVPTGRLFLSIDGTPPAATPAESGNDIFIRKSMIVQAVEAYAQGTYSDWAYLLSVGTLKTEQEERKYPQHDARIPERTIDAVYYRSGGVCEGCGDETRLELHHLHYQTAYGQETPQDLALFCRTCHAAQHPDKQLELDL